MTDTIEAAQLADMICDCANREQHRRDVKLIEDYVAARITAHTKALIEGAGEVVAELNGRTCSLALNVKTAATIAVLKAEIERLTEREARAKLDGVRAGIEASAKLGENRQWSVGLRAHEIRALDAAAIAKGEG